MNIKSAIILSLALPAPFYVSSSFAVEAKGAVIIRIPDGASSRCINSSTDQVWLTLRRVILNKESGLFTEDKYAGVIINTTISGKTGSKTEKVSFPRMIEADIESYSKGHGVSIPLEFGLLEGLQLKNENASYLNVDFDFNIIKGKKRNAWGEALNGLVTITKNLPIPANPFAEGFQFFAGYANSLVESSVQQKQADNIKQGNIKLSFSPNGQCRNTGFESNGTIAVIYASPGLEKDGFFDITKTNDNSYCWATQLTPAFSLAYGKTAADGSCKEPITVRNDYFGFFVNAVPVSSTEAAGLREDVSIAAKRPVVSGKKAQELYDFAAFSKDGNNELRFKTLAALEWDPRSKDLPFGDFVAKTDSDAIVWRTTPVESTAFDVAEALRRCSANGMEPQKCLGGRLPLAGQDNNYK